MDLIGATAMHITAHTVILLDRVKKKRNPQKRYCHSNAYENKFYTIKYAIKLHANISFSAWKIIVQVDNLTQLIDQSSVFQCLHQFFHYKIYL